MALSILDGNQSATTLSTILSSGQHITAHTVVSLGTQAITDIVNATSAGLTNTQLRASAVTVGGTVTVGNSITISSLPPISGTVTVSNISSLPDGGGNAVVRNFVFGYDYDNEVPIAIASDGNALKISGTVAIGNSVTIGSLPALVAGTAQVGSVTASISNTAITVYSAQGTTVTNSNFTSTTASTTLVSAVAGRDVLTVFNEGAGNLFISPGATATTISYQVRLSAGDYWECPEGQRSLAHTAVFATAGTARVTEVS